MVSDGNKEEYQQQNQIRPPGTQICGETWALMQFGKVYNDNDETYTLKDTQRYLAPQIRKPYDFKLFYI